MTITYSPSDIARREKGKDSAEGIWITGLIVVEGGVLRIAEIDREEIRIDVVDPIFANSDTLRSWPLAPLAKCLVYVDIKWVLTTVQIRRINQLHLACPWANQGLYKYVTLHDVDEA